MTSEASVNPISSTTATTTENHMDYSRGFFCVTCNHRIEKEADIRWINGKLFHSTCLKCEKCSKKFAFPTYMYQVHRKLVCRENVTCNPHRGDVKCAVCLKLIEAKEFNSIHTDNHGHYYHSECHKCIVCSGKLAPLVTVHALGHPYHPACLRCEKCIELLKLWTHRELDKKLMCPKCHDRLYYPACVTCKKPIMDVVLQLGASDYYHESCLKCVRCKKSINEQYFLHPVSCKPVCLKCSETVKVEGKAGGKKANKQSNQVRCGLCQHRTPRPRLSKGGVPACRTCLNKEGRGGGQQDEEGERSEPPSENSKSRHKSKGKKSEAPTSKGETNKSTKKSIGKRQKR